MNKLKTLFSVTLLSTAIISAGCAKKVKPDDSLNGSASLIQDKDLDFAAAGSDSGKIPGLVSVHFDYDKSTLSKEARDELTTDAVWMKKNKGKLVQIEGHCDRHGSTEYNLALGERRANAVKKYLENLGVDGKRLTTISYGKEKLLDTAETEEADSKNRRANFRPTDGVILKKLTGL